MFRAFKRKKTEQSHGLAEPVEDSTSFSLSAAVPRPSEIQPHERLLMPSAKLVADGASSLCRVRNLSAGGMTVEAVAPLLVGTRVEIELSSNRIVSGQVVWVRQGLLGVKFDPSVDICALFSEESGEAELPARPPRIEVGCGATIRIGKLYHQVQVQDVSLGGMKVALDDPDCIGREVTVTIESLRPASGRICWHRDGYAGIVFDAPYSFEELGEWLAKRIEIASLRPGPRDGLRR
jgi:hypothetical protein